MIPRERAITMTPTRGGSKEGQGAEAPYKKSGPPVAPPTAPSKVNDAGILLNYVVIASNVYM